MCDHLAVSQMNLLTHQMDEPILVKCWCSGVCVGVRGPELLKILEYCSSSPSSSGGGIQFSFFHFISVGSVGL